MNQQMAALAVIPIAITVLTSPAHAALLAYEGMSSNGAPVGEYVAGDNLAGNSGGTGWGTAWQAVNGAVSYLANPDGLAYPQLETDDDVNYTQGGGFVLFQRDLASSITSGSIYVSVLIENLADGGGDDVGHIRYLSESGADLGTFGIDSNQAYVADSWYTGDQQLVPGAPLGAGPHLFVVKIDIDNDLVSLFLNPTVGEGEPAATLTNVRESGISGIGGIQLNTIGGNYAYDEIRVGTTFESVTPLIPEPASAALIATGALVVLRRGSRA
ncbi:MAG: hypothetical protein AAGD11_19400 [Planctomycetota bacterium]